MNKLIRTSCLVGALGIAASGCVSTVDSVENYNKTAVPNEVIRLHVETDASQPIKVSNLIDKIASNGFKQIAVEFYNTSSSARTALYRCEWYDESGFPVTTSLTQWSEIRLLGRDSRLITFTAPNARAHDYKIRIIEK
jgi:uncharacterized protein YcfL